VEAALAGGDVDPVTDELSEIYVEVYSEVEALTAALTPAGLKAAIKRFIRSVRGRNQPHHQGFISPTTSLALANAVLNDRHPLCLWCRHRNGVGVHEDAAVRHTHDVADGQRQLLGRSFR